MTEPQPETKAELQATEADATTEEMPVDNLLGLKLLVVFMGVLLIVCIIAFFAILFIKGVKKDEPALAETPEMVLNLSDQEKVTNMTFGGRDLALQIEGPEGRRIVIVNPYTADHKAVIHLEKQD